MILEKGAQVMHRDTILVIPNDRLEEAYLLASFCPRCQTYWLPHFDLCPSCLAQEMEQKALSREGSLYSYTTMHTGYPGFTVPYTVGYVDFPEGVRLIGQIECSNPTDLKPDQKVKLAVGIIKHTDDQPVYSWKFVPVA